MIVPVMAISNLVLTQQIYSEETNGAHAHYREPVPLKNTHKNPKFGRVRQVPIRELGWEFLGWDLSHCGKFGIFMGYSLNTLKYPNMGIRYFFLCIFLLFSNEISQRSHS